MHVWLEANYLAMLGLPGSSAAAVLAAAVLAAADCRTPTRAPACRWATLHDIVCHLSDHWGVGKTAWAFCDPASERHARSGACVHGCSVEFVAGARARGSALPWPETAPQAQVEALKA